MIRWKRAVALLLLLLLLLPPCAALAEGEKDDAPPAQADALLVGAPEQEAENSSLRVNAAAEESLRRQIEDTYAAAKKRARRKSFKGYCGAYVANQLVVLGINTSYLSANGNNTFELYRDLEITSGGYRVTAYGARDYTLEEALRAIMGRNTAVRNILVGFHREEVRPRAVHPRHPKREGVLFRQLRPDRRRREIQGRGAHRVLPGILPGSIRRV